MVELNRNLILRSELYVSCSWLKVENKAMMIFVFKGTFSNW